MWADTLELAERAFLLRLLAWSAASILAGTAVLAWLRVGARRSALLRHFAIQSAAWGMAEAIVGLALLARIAPRDLASATRLDRLLWLSAGLDAGYIIAGALLLTIGWQLGRRLGLVGAGIAVVIQGIALGMLDLILAAQIFR